MVRTITNEELKSRIDRGERLRLVNVRDTAIFKKEQIVRAIHLLIAELSPENAGFIFARYDLIVTYSHDKDRPAKRSDAQRLLDYGFTNVLA